ncbi:hypothetical protein VNO78_35265 [Psophocarpus tetragonolobus]|uniref:Uncharacterized protein n=1 Tax=Psophocarpus tetragonolobus TaxID=3891 RepID=A0AAN9RGZ0_PSOTE
MSVSARLSRSDPPDEKLHSALLLSRRTYPPGDSWNFYGLRTTSPLTTNQQTSSGWSCRYQQQEKNNQMETAINYGSWPRQRPRRRGDRSNKERLDDVFIPGLQ